MISNIKGIATGVTLTNPNDEQNVRSIKVRLHATGQEVTAIYINPITLDHREQRPNIKTGSEVILIFDDLYNFYVLGTIQQGIDLIDKKQYKIENADMVQILTDKQFLANGINQTYIDNTNFKTSKFEVENDTAQLLHTLSDTLKAFMELSIVIGNMGQPAYITPELKAKLQELKDKIDSFL